MVDAIDLEHIRYRAKSILSSMTCSKIRFRLEIVHIQRHMYAYIGGAIVDRRVPVELGGGNGYDPDSDPPAIHWESVKVAPKAIVHEATHAVINATHVGAFITKATHEAAAYLAESMFELLSGQDPETDVNHLTGPVTRLAQSAISFHESNPSATFTCPVSDTSLIKSILAASRNAGDYWTPKVQVGLKDPYEPISYSSLTKWLRGWWRVYDGNYYYYHFSEQPIVTYTKTEPANSTVPPSSTQNRGKVSISDSPPHVVIRWDSGTVEKFTRVNWTSETEMNGTSNRYSPPFARKIE
jgi:hypothetical protein